MAKSALKPLMLEGNILQLWLSAQEKFLAEVCQESQNDEEPHSRNLHRFIPTRHNVAAESSTKLEYVWFLEYPPYRQLLLSTGTAQKLI